MITQYNTKIKVSQNGINSTMLKAGSNAVKALKSKNNKLFICSIVLLNNTLEEQIKYLFMKRLEKIPPETFSLQKLSYYLQIKTKDVYRIKQARNLIVHAIDQIKIAGLFMSNKKENLKMINAITTVIWQIQNLLYEEDQRYKQRMILAVTA